MDQINSFMALLGLPDSISNRVIAAYFIYSMKNTNDAINAYYSDPSTVRAIKANVAGYEKYYTYFEQQAGIRNEASTSGKMEMAMNIFNRYREPRMNAFGVEYIGVDGTIQFLSDLGIEPEDLDALVLAFYLNAKEVGVFERGDFVSGWCSINALDLPQMRDFIKSKTQEIDNEDMDGDLFMQVYKFTFGYVLDKNDKANIQKQLPLDEAVEYWKLLLPKDLNGCDEFFKWLLESSNRKKIKRDEWNMVPSFLKLVSNGKVSFLNQYSEDDAWPLLMDDYVDYLVNSN